MCICCRTCICDCDLPGLWGTGNGTTSYSENIGAIGVTKVDSCTVACGLHCGTKQNMATSLTIKAACFFSVFMHTNYLDKFGSIRIIFNHFNLKSTPVLNGSSCNTYNSKNSKNATNITAHLCPCLLVFGFLSFERTQVGSRRVVQWGAGLMMLFGIFSKFFGDFWLVNVRKIDLK